MLLCYYRKLEEVRSKLGQLRGLVHYYQSGQDFIHGTGDTESHLTAEDNVWI